MREGPLHDAMRRAVREGPLDDSSPLVRTVRNWDMQYYRIRFLVLQPEPNGNLRVNTFFSNQEDYARTGRHFRHLRIGSPTTFPEFRPFYLTDGLNAPVMDWAGSTFGSMVEIRLGVHGDKEESWTIPVHAVTALFTKSQSLQHFCSDATIIGDADGFQQLANAMAGSTSLKTFDCSGNNGGRPNEQKDWHRFELLAPNRGRAYISSMTHQPRSSSKWDPVIRAVASLNANTLKHLSIFSDEETGMTLTKETTSKLMKHSDQVLKLPRIPFTLRFSSIQDVVNYCVCWSQHVARLEDSQLLQIVRKILRVNVQVEEPDNKFLCDFLDANAIEAPRFSMCVTRSHGSEMYTEEWLLDIHVSNELADPQRILDAVQTALLFEHTATIDHVNNEEGLFMYQQLQENKLWSVSGESIENDWIQMMAVLGNLPRGFSMGRMHFNLTPLFNMMRQFPHRVSPCGGSNLSERTISGLRNHVASLKETNASKDAIIAAYKKRIAALEKKLDAPTETAGQTRKEMEVASSNETVAMRVKRRRKQTKLSQY